jgi:putative DNA primase/helicase
LAPGIDENSKEQYDPINQWFLELRAAGITTIFLHHAGKSGLQRGTSGREDNIDVSLFLNRPKDYSPEQGARFVTKFEKSRVRHADSYLLGEMELQAAPDKDTGVYVWAFGNQKKNTRIEVLRLLDEGVTVSAIAPAVKISTSMVYRLRREAVEEGLLQEENFRLTPSGKTWIEKNG